MKQDIETTSHQLSGIQMKWDVLKWQDNQQNMITKEKKNCFIDEVMDN